MDVTCRKTLPTLYKKSANGSISEWSVIVDELSNGSAMLTVRHGYKSGIIQESSTTFTEGKNKGRSNETTPFEQALSEAKSRHSKQARLGYSESPDGSDMSLRPMLAHDAKDREVKYPVFVQPKLDGMRCVSYLEGDRVVLMSRGSKEYKGLDHIRRALVGVLDEGIVLDGELYNHDLHADFGALSSRIMKGQDGTLDIQYHVYDMILDGTFVERHDTLKQILAQRPDHQTICKVPTYTANSFHDVKKYHDFWVSRGYEGAMMRVGDCEYRAGYRSKDLLKVKIFQDAEFEITGVVSGRGRAEGHAVFVCKTQTGREFSVMPNGTSEYRKELLNKGDELIGKMLTVRYFGMCSGDDPAPRFPKGVAIREEGY